MASDEEHASSERVTSTPAPAEYSMPRARLWRQMLSDSERLKRNRPELILEALDAVEELERV